MSTRPRRSKTNYTQSQHTSISDIQEDDNDSDADVEPPVDEEDDDDGDDDVDDDEEEEVEQVDEDGAPLVKNGKSKPKNKPRQLSPKEINNKKDIRTSKQITSIKEKFLRFFGSNEEKLVQLVQTRKNWEESIFEIPRDKLLHETNRIDITVPAIEYNTISKESLASNFKFNGGKKFQFDLNEPVNIPVGSNVKSDQTIVINTGGLITDVAWSEDGEFLAVSVLEDSNSTITPEFSVLTKHQYKAAIFVYKVDSKKNISELHRTLVHNWGGAWDLKWLPLNKDILSAVFNDGTVKLLDVNGIPKDIVEVTKPSLEYSIPGYIISTYDWNRNSIICGTNTGHIAEFLISDEDSSPSYLYSIHSDYIFSISVGLSNFDETLVYSSASDGTSAIFSTRDIVGSLEKTPRSKAVCKTVTYSPQLFSFIQLEGPYSAKLIPSRALFASTAIVKHDGSTESIASSSLHPFVISGGADGKIKLANLARRLLNGQKQTLQSHKILTLAQLQYGQDEDTYRLVKSLDVETLNPNDNISSVNIFPPQVSISSIAWSGNINSGTWFAAGSTGGLLIIDHV